MLMSSLRIVGGLTTREGRAALVVPALLLACLAGTAHAQCGVTAFGAATTTTAGTGARSIAVGDFNGDGKADTAIANFDANTISIRLGTGLGTFTAGTTLNSSGAWECVAGDLNNDGKLDLAVCNSSGTTVTTFLGNGNGTFAAGAAQTVGSAPRGVALADLNADGKLDLISANNSSFATSVRLGNGNGTFAAAVNYFGDANANEVTVGDVNGDGKLDVLTTLPGTTGIKVRLGNGNGTLAAPTTIAGVGGGGTLLIDINNDGKLDVLVLNQVLNQVFIVKGNGNGTFQVPTTLAVANVGYGWTMSAGDFNADGNIDIAVPRANVKLLGIYNGTGTGTFTAGPTLATGIEPCGAATGDFNGDGRPDVAVANSDTATVSSFLNTTTSVAQFVTQPVPAGECRGTFVTMNIAATGVGLTYRWQQQRPSEGWLNLSDGASVSGALTDTLVVTNNSAAYPSINYRCMVTNTCGSVPSNLARVDWYAPVEITAQPVPDAACRGTNVTMNVTATGDSMTYRWQQQRLSEGWLNLSDGPDVSGAFTDTLVVTNTNAAYASINYRCRITGTCGLVTSDVAGVDWYSPPSITTQPEPTEVCKSGTIVLNAITPGGDLTYRWARSTGGSGFVNLSDNARVSGSTTPTLTITDARQGDQGTYRLRVFGSCGPTVDSTLVGVTVNAADFNCDGFLDFTDFDGFVAAFEEGGDAADFNGDGFLDFTDFDEFVSAFENGAGA
jgi:hypothetical protein